MPKLLKPHEHHSRGVKQPVVGNDELYSTCILSLVWIVVTDVQYMCLRNPLSLGIPTWFGGDGHSHLQGCFFCEIFNKQAFSFRLKHYICIYMCGTRIWTFTIESIKVPTCTWYYTIYGVYKRITTWCYRIPTTTTSCLAANDGPCCFGKVPAARKKETCSLFG